MIEKRTLRAMAVGSGLAVANNYYAQPLLADMGRHFGVSDRRMGLVAMLSQVGYAAGLLLFVPLGDRLERRSFILSMLGAVTVALLGIAAAPSFAWLAAASLAVGITTITPQLLVPFAAHLAEPQERGRVVGTVMSGLLIGVLAARTVGGFVGEYLGWRAMYVIAAAVMIALALALRARLPRSDPGASGLSYPALLRSIGGLVRDEPVLRQSCLFGAMSFGAFSAFWSTLAFHLSRPPFGYPSGVVGLFGLVGIVGALAASLAGRSADRRSPRWGIGMGLAVSCSPTSSSTVPAERSGAWSWASSCSTSGAVGPHLQPVPDLRHPARGPQPDEHRLHGRLLRRRCGGLLWRGVGLEPGGLGRRLPDGPGHDSPGTAWLRCHGGGRSTGVAISRGGS